MIKLSKNMVEIPLPATEPSNDSQGWLWTCDNCKQGTDFIITYNGSIGSEWLKGKDLCVDCMDEVDKNAK